ncbi:MAG: CBS domain-containing protein [Pikeienuella sp.]
MNVKQLMGDRKPADIETISENATLADAASRLSARKIGALMVSKDDGGVAGILSERDIVRRVASDGAGALATLVSAAMTANVVSCGPTDLAHSLLQRMTEGRFRHMPVIEDGSLIGIISIGDVVKAHISEIEMEKEAMENMIRGM